MKKSKKETQLFRYSTKTEDHITCKIPEEKIITSKRVIHNIYEIKMELKLF